MIRNRFRGKKNNILKKYFTIIIGATFMALAVNLVYEPMGLVTGGLAGLGIVVKSMTAQFMDGGFPIWLFTVISNIPVFLIAIKIKGKKFILSVFVGTTTYVLAMLVMPIFEFPLNDYLLASIIGGVIGGIGIGMVFSVSASTGGTDLVATIFHSYKKHISVPQILTFIDGAIIFIGALVFGIGNALYAIIAVFITSKVSDGILEGLKFAKMAYIISDEYSQIAESILNSINRGVTGIGAKGMYSNKDRKMLFCVVSKKEIVRIIEIAQKIDPKSFVIVSDVREVMGEGFIEYRQ